MNLTEEQRQSVAGWIEKGAKLAEIQNRLASEFGIKLTYMEARFLVDDLKLTPKDPEPPKVVVPEAKPAGKPAAVVPNPAEVEPPPAAMGGKVSVGVDQIARPERLSAARLPSATVRPRSGTWIRRAGLAWCRNRRDTNRRPPMCRNFNLLCSRKSPGSAISDGAGWLIRGG